MCGPTGIQKQGETKKTKFQMNKKKRIS